MRPAVVVTADALNRARRTVIVVPLAAGPRPRPPIVVATPSAGEGRVAVCDQARAVNEIEPEGAAAVEVRQLFAEIWRRLNGQAHAPLRSANEDVRRPALTNLRLVPGA